ncbi:aminotransferase class I/II-fold pyridoxal phosphate-dependent enzyme [candidate division WWE3 bacterium]|uniref:Aminotransferase class I/II-fold pyridoxal phosphate-dependent enzyme n=1 Tax=candidate division WWE3 bacterium TaxID=2053526 RepID=A0A955LLP0_UNCKA|nr:aminotransferase class I/II-fold pyridoxal phosphate-dependent enzyme [candidate division WWE3 bacterium]
MNIPHKTSPTLAINQKVKDLRAQGESVINAGFGENRFPLHPKLKSSDPEFHTDYESVQGILPLRKAVSTFYKTINNEDVKSANVIITPGCKGALFSAVAILDGDLLLPAPSWVSYAPQAIISGKKVVHVPTSAAHDYVPTYDELELAHTQAVNQGHDPKVLILNYPNNPTSCIATKGQIEDIVRFCKEHDIAVISDEIYSQLTFHDNEHVKFSDY